MFDFFFTAQGLFYGSGSHFYNRQCYVKPGCRPEDHSDRDVFVRDTPNLMDSQESLFCQYKALEHVPQPLLVFSAFHAGPGQVWFGSWRPQGRVDLALVVPAADGGVIWKMYNYHGFDHRADDGGDGLNADTREKDQLKHAYAMRMSEVHPTVLRFEYHITGEAEWSRLDLRRRLASTWPTEACLGFPQKQLTWRTLRRWLLDPPPSWGGFVVVHRGTETRRDGLARLGCCVQRRPVQVSELGPYTRFQAARATSNDPVATQRLLHARCAQPQTLSCLGFHAEGEVLADRYFAFLYRQRRLRGFVISHAILYRAKTWLNPYMDHLLQRRHEAKRSGQKRFALMLKLICNAFFGFSSLRSERYPMSFLVRESSLRARKRRLRLLNPSTLQDVQIMGVINDELLYLFTHTNAHSQIRNCLQTAACILSRSKALFLHSMHRLAAMVPPDSMETVYVDTDGVIIALGEDVPWPLTDDVEAWGQLFEKADAGSHQSGLFKLETACRCVLVRGVKMYMMGPSAAAEPPSKKIKALPSKTHSFVTPTDFMGFSAPPRPITFVSMVPTAAGEVIIRQEQKNLISALNIKRKMLVSLVASRTGCSLLTGSLVSEVSESRAFGATGLPAAAAG